ncbi:guanylate kinase [Paenibacillus sp. NPDC058071]|uniref:guanylate kinase n=1 Tax=Paenibacillus sp. NPDC058071 TaxID=3346326 RepID=UPI0036DA8E34
MKWHLIVFQGPSASGKSSLQAMLGVPRVVTWTSRPPRSGEVQGQHYYFGTKAQMAVMLEKGELLEMTEYQGHYYGTHLDAIKEAVERGETRSIVLDANGVKKVREQFGQSILVIGVKADKAQCRDRLLKRASDEADATRRLASFDDEIEALVDCDLVIYNSDDNKEKSDLLIRYIKEGLERDYS